MAFQKLLKNDITTLILRILIVLSVVWILRITFYLYNVQLVKIEDWGKELPALIKGSFIFDASNLVMVFGIFIFLSLIPFRFRANKVYQKTLFILFIILTVALVLINLTDTVYFRYVSKRITLDEFTYFKNDNTGTIILKSVGDNLLLILVAVGLIWGAVWTYKKVKYYPTRLSNWAYYPLNLVVLALVAGLAVVAIRGGTSRAIRPITMSNASQFAETPAKTFIVLNNPFCILRSIGNNDIEYTKYFSEQELDSLYIPVHYPADTSAVKKKNVVIFVLESFSYEHSKFLNPDLYPEKESYTPFLDSLMQQGYIFDRCYANGKVSIDALPSVLASIPSFKTHFALTNQAVSPMDGLGTVLGKEGWDSWFFNGSEERSMGFVAFAKNAGYKNFRMREQYEEKRGTNDFDGYWGIWDEPFLQYVSEELSSVKQPFLATTFTLTSHHPYVIPDKYKNILPKGKTQGHQCVAYTDNALREFFNTARKTDWYNNTVFVIVADHVSIERYSPKTNIPPEDKHIMYFIYTPDGSVKGRSAAVTQQIDIMPTLLGLLNYNKPYFAFGRDVFNEKNGAFAVNYSGKEFNWITDSATYNFDEKTTGNLAVDKKVKAFVQRYYLQMEKRKFTAK